MNGMAVRLWNRLMGWQQGPRQTRDFTLCITKLVECFATRYSNGHWLILLWKQARYINEGRWVYHRLLAMTAQWSLHVPRQCTRCSVGMLGTALLLGFPRAGHCWKHDRTDGTLFWSSKTSLIFFRSKSTRKEQPSLARTSWLWGLQLHSFKPSIPEKIKTQ